MAKHSSLSWCGICIVFKETSGGSLQSAAWLLWDRCNLLILSRSNLSGSHTHFQHGGPSSSVSKTTDFENISWSHSSGFQYFISRSRRRAENNPNNNTGAHVHLSECCGEWKILWVKVKRKCYLLLLPKATGGLSSPSLDLPANCRSVKITGTQSWRAAREVNYGLHSCYFHYLLKKGNPNCTLWREMKCREQFKLPHYGIR